MEKLGISKIDDQKTFDGLLKEEKGKSIKKSRTEALAVQGKAQELAGKGKEIKSEHYFEADKLLDEEKIPFSHEVFSEDGNLEPAEITEERTRSFLDDFIRDNGDLNTPELKIFLNKVDFGLLKKIFIDELEKYGIPKEKANFLGPDNIVSRHANKFFAMGSTYAPELNLIIVESFEDHPGVDKRKEIEIFGSKDIELLTTLIHEETHAIGRNVCIGWRLAPIPAEYAHKYKTKAHGGEMQSKASGLSLLARNDKFKSEEYPKCREIFTMLNEAVVEKMSKEIVVKYLDASEWPQEEIAIYKNNLEDSKTTSGYDDTVSMLNLIIQKISSKKGFQENEVWDFFKRGLLKGEKFEREAVKKLFEEVFGPEFLEDFAYLPHLMFTGAKDHLDNFKKKYEL